MNLEHDIDEGGVQMILLVEDSIRFYSSILPNLYNYILAQSKRFSTEDSTATLLRCVCVADRKWCWHATMRRRWHSTNATRTTCSA